jgi:calcineurin-like phosphoesterase family protein
MTFWNKAHYGSVMLHGHCHGTHQATGRSIDVGYDAHGRILLLDEAIAMCNAKPIHEKFD